MRTIAKFFDTIAEADQFQNMLYDRYEYVRSIRSPLFSESGIYVWQVR